MKLFRIVTMLVLLAVGLSAAELAGAWKGSMDTQMGAVEMTLKFETGATPAGSVSSPMFEARMEKLKFEGDKVSFEINIDQGHVSFEGTLAGDELKLTVTGTQGDKYPLNCKRQK